jgi:hypothetical protein
MEYNQIFQPQTLEKLNQRSQDNLKKIMGNKSLMQTMISSQKLLGEIMNIEKPYKEQLEQLAIQMVEDMYPIILEDNINIDAKITNVADVNRSLDENINESTPESKRRVINGITQGAALHGTFSFYMFKEYLDAIDDTLVEKYNQLMKEVFGVYDDDNAIAMFLNAIAQGQKTGGGSSKVIIKEIKLKNPYDKNSQEIIDLIYDNKIKDINNILINNNVDILYMFSKDEYDSMSQNQRNKLYNDLKQNIINNINENNQSGPTIQARAICFPMLVHEIIKGLYELVSLQGFSGTKDQNQQVVDKVDKLENEPHDLKYGKFIYEALNNIFADSDYNDSRIKEFFFIEVYQLGDNEFVEFVENAINEQLSSSQKKWVDRILKEISMDIRDDDFDSTGLDEVKKFNNINEYTIDDEEVEEFLKELKKCSTDLKEGVLEEAEYKGRKVTLNKPMQGDVKKSKVYVKNEKGNIVKVNFGQKGMSIKKNNPERRKAFRARHNCDNPGPKWKARYWSCKAW